MEDRNFERLVECLRCIRTDACMDPAEIEKMAGPYRELGYELMSLQKEVSRLKEVAQKTQFRADMVEGYHELMMELTRKREEWVIVIDAASREVVYCNKRRTVGEEPEDCTSCGRQLAFRHRLLDWKEEEQGKNWEADNGSGKYYRILSFSMEWRGRTSSAHVVVDITEEKRTQMLADKAYHDHGTGIYNRMFFEEQMGRMLSDQEDFTLGYMDLDGLKTVNDDYGHLEGDAYIRRFVSGIQGIFRSSDTFARLGGDEFCIVVSGCMKAEMEEKLSLELERFVRENEKVYSVSFSFGVVEVCGAENTKSREEILEEADTRMYQCKSINKKKYHAHYKR